MTDHAELIKGVRALLAGWLELVSRLEASAGSEEARASAAQLRATISVQFALLDVLEQNISLLELQIGAAGKPFVQLFSLETFQEPEELSRRIGRIKLPSEKSRSRLVWESTVEQTAEAPAFDFEVQPAAMVPASESPALPAEPFLDVAPGDTAFDPTGTFDQPDSGEVAPGESQEIQWRGAVGADFAGTAGEDEVRPGPPAVAPPRPVPSVSPPTEVDQGKDIEVTVFFATNRKLASNSADAVTFLNEPGDTTWGECQVRIPGDHQIGEIEEWTLWRWVTGRHPMQVIEAKALPRVDALRRMRDEVLAEQPQVLLFVHGFNVGFRAAALRTAQLAWDLSYPGPSIFFAWPSKDTTVLYTHDEQAAEISQPALQDVLFDLCTELGATRIHVIAHSLGARLLTRALKELSSATDPRAVAVGEQIEQIVLAAPDIDATVFRTQVAPALLPRWRRMTVYVCPRDRALAASRVVHGGDRAGEVVVPATGVDTIDADAVVLDDDVLKHSYFARRTVLTDVFQLLRGLKPAQRMGLRLRRREAYKYWVLAR